MIAPRAAFEITRSCPDRYALTIRECINNGWLKAVAHRPVHEEFMEKISNDKYF
jgi:hypothetical protein